MASPVPLPSGNGETPPGTWAWVPPRPQPTRPPLRRAHRGSPGMPAPWVGGVCSGLSVHLGIPVPWVRLAFVVLGLAVLPGAALYVWLLVMVPVDGAHAQPRALRLSKGLVRGPEEPQGHRAQNQLLTAGVAILGLALALVVLVSSGTISVSGVLPLLVVLAGLAMVWSQGPRLDRWRSPTVLAMVGGGIALVLLGLIVLLSRGDPPAALLRGGLIGVVVCVGVLVAVAPIWARQTSQLSASREQQVRDAERADIAAHLHDSVLQTLTLIRASAEDPTRVRALALTQERELRSWLYTGHEEAATSLAEAIRETVGQVESTYGVAVDVVAVGDTVPGPAELAAVAATGEAVTNAVRHGAPPISVYAEVGPDTVDVFVKDTGSGFDPNAIPEDRHGVRQSIIGRAERVGGRARVRPLATGTEVHIQVPRTPPTPDPTPPSIR